MIPNYYVIVFFKVYVGRPNGQNDGRRGLDKFCRELAEQIEKYFSQSYDIQIQNILNTSTKIDSKG